MQSLPLDFIVRFCQEMIPGRGEDSYCTAFCDSAGLLAVFDGCGGAGARTHDHYSGHTEAYIASRLCAGAFYDQFHALFPCDMPAQQLAEQVFAPAALGALKRYSPPAEPGGIVMKGSMVRTLPTTAAAALVRPGKDGKLELAAMWAGDSRVYVLDDWGLAQLTVDDTSVPDPMDNVYDDGVLRNVLCSDRDVQLHCAVVELSPPFAVFSATDGCFGYVPSPMEFEGLVLQSLLSAPTPDRWEQALQQAMGAVAGDDHCLCMAVLGYGSFEAFKSRLAPRFTWLQTHFLSGLQQIPVEDRDARFALWERYRDGYFRLRKGGAAHG